jgi:hypothetical protein
VLDVLVERQQPRELDAAGDARLVGPGPGDVADGVAAAAEDDGRKIEGLDEADAVRMAFH